MAGAPLLTSFCGTILTKEEIENIILATIDGFLSNELGKKLFRTFLEKGRKNNASDCPPIFNTLECYELSYTVGRSTKLNESVYDQLIKLCPSYALENSLTEAYKTGDSQQVATAIANIMRECKLLIEKSHEYAAYREQLCNKIKNH